MNTEVIELTKLWEMHPVPKRIVPVSFELEQKGILVVSSKPPKYETYTYISRDLRLMMGATSINSIKEGRLMLETWIKGLVFLRDIQGFHNVHSKTDDETGLKKLPWVNQLLRQYPDALDMVFYVMHQPFKELTGDVRGVCLVTAYGNFISVSELDVKEEVSEDTLRQVLSGEAYKNGLIADE